MDEAIQVLCEDLAREGIHATSEQLREYGQYISRLSKHARLPLSPEQVLGNCVDDAGCWESLVEWLGRQSTPTPGAAGRSET